MAFGTDHILAPHIKQRESRRETQLSVMGTPSTSPPIVLSTWNRTWELNSDR